MNTITQACIVPGATFQPEIVFSDNTGHTVFSSPVSDLHLTSPVTGLTSDGSEYALTLAPVPLSGLLSRLHTPEHNESLLGGWHLPPIKRVHFNGDKCIILWDEPDSENNKTVVTCGKGETFDRYTGFMAAVCKKLFGGTTSAKKLLDEKDAGLQAALQAAQAAREKAKRLTAEAEHAKRAHERKVKAAMKQIAIHTEAAQRLQDGDYQPRHAKKIEDVNLFDGAEK